MKKKFFMEVNFAFAVDEKLSSTCLIVCGMSPALAGSFEFPPVELLIFHKWFFRSVYTRDSQITFWTLIASLPNDR